MKRLLLLLTVLVTALFGATKLNLLDVRPLANGPTSLYILAVGAGGGPWTPVILDPAGSVTIDTTVSPAVLKATPGPPGTVLATDDFVASAGTTLFTTSAAPKSTVHVFRNGQLYRPVFLDYTEATDPVTKRVSVSIPLALAGDGIVLTYQK